MVVGTGRHDANSQRSALSITNAYLLPFPPRTINLWTSGKVNLLAGKTADVNPAMRAFLLFAKADTDGLSGTAGKQAVH